MKRGRKATLHDLWVCCFFGGARKVAIWRKKSLRQKRWANFIAENGAKERPLNVNAKKYCYTFHVVRKKTNNRHKGETEEVSVVVTCFYLRRSRQVIGHKISCCSRCCCWDVESFFFWAFPPPNYTAQYKLAPLQLCFLIEPQVFGWSLFLFSPSPPSSHPPSHSAVLLEPPGNGDGPDFWEILLLPPSLKEREVKTLSLSHWVVTGRIFLILLLLLLCLGKGEEEGFMTNLTQRKVLTASKQHRLASTASSITPPPPAPFPPKILPKTMGNSEEGWTSVNIGRRGYHLGRRRRRKRETDLPCC